MRLLVAVAAACLMAAALAAPVAATKPDRGCPNEQFELMTYQEFRDLSLAVGVPEELLGPEHAALFDTFDRNDDDLVCIKDLPDTPGHLGTWVFNAIDDSASH